MLINRRLIIAAAVGAASLLLVPAAIADETANAAVVKDYLAAWNEHSIDKAVAHFADDVVYYDASVGEPLTGKAD